MGRLSECNDEWSIVAMCGRCHRLVTLGRVSEIENARACVTVEDLRNRLRCRRCGAHRPTLSAKFVGTRRN